MNPIEVGWIYRINLLTVALNSGFLYNFDISKEERAQLAELANREYLLWNMSHHHRRDFGRLFTQLEPTAKTLEMRDRLIGLLGNWRTRQALARGYLAGAQF